MLNIHGQQKYTDVSPPCGHQDSFISSFEEHMPYLKEGLMTFITLLY